MDTPTMRLVADEVDAFLAAEVNITADDRMAMLSRALREAKAMAEAGATTARVFPIELYVLRVVVREDQRLGASGHRVQVRVVISKIHVGTFGFVINDDPGPADPELTGLAWE